MADRLREQPLLREYRRYKFLTRMPPRVTGRHPCSIQQKSGIFAPYTFLLIISAATRLAIFKRLYAIRVPPFCFRARWHPSCPGDPEQCCCYHRVAQVPIFAHAYTSGCFCLGKRIILSKNHLSSGLLRELLEKGSISGVVSVVRKLHEATEISTEFLALTEKHPAPPSGTAGEQGDFQEKESEGQKRVHRPDIRGGVPDGPHPAASP